MSINAEETTKNLIKWIQDWIQLNGNDDSKVVIGVSGGKDSSVNLALLVKAIGPERVIPVLMPNGIQSDIEDSYRVCRWAGVDPIVVNIEKYYNALSDEAKRFNKGQLTDQYKTNAPARLRMVTLYAIAQQTGNCFVINNSNLSECKLGWGTLWGDTVGDFGPIRNLFVDEVVAVGDYLGLPKSLTHKTPSDGMCGMSDEEKLGFSYDDLKKVIRKEYEGLDSETVLKIHKKIDGSSWKRSLMSIPAMSCAEVVKE